jgi:O-antigen biosynthesis protein
MKFLIFQSDLFSMLIIIKNKLRRIPFFVFLYRKLVQFFKNRNQDNLNNYIQVIKTNDTSLLLLSNIISNFNIKFSIISPIFKPEIASFKAMVNSISMQSFKNWELILVDDASKQSFLSDLLDNLALNTKIKSIANTENKHISITSNIALHSCTGDWVVLLDHDDLLHPQALKTIALYAQLNPQAQLMYSDEDKVMAYEERDHPHFKSDWNPDLLYSQNYICHLTAIKRELLEKIGGFRVGYEGSQDHDMVLRATKHLRAEQIIHIPYVLYHWRMTENSTAQNPNAKSYTQIAGRKAVSDFFADQPGVDVLDGMLPNTYRVKWPVPTPAPQVSVIIPTRNGLKLVKQCIESLYRYTQYPNFEVLLIDNQSDDSEALAYFASLEQQGKIRLIAYDHPFNYSAINNYAVTQAQGEIIILMNNDIELQHDGWMEEMVSQALRPDIGCVGAKLYYPNGTIQHAGVILGIGGVAGHAHKYFPKDHHGYFSRLKVIHNVSAVTAACLAVKKSIFHEVAGLDAEHLAIAFNDVDFCLKVRNAGYRNLWTPYAEMVHHESVSRGTEDTPEKQARFHREVRFMKEKWGQALNEDPYYSPWLSLTHEDFRLREF